MDKAWSVLEMTVRKGLESGEYPSLFDPRARSDGGALTTALRCIEICIWSIIER